jgi:hypothetical protein
MATHGAIVLEEPQEPDFPAFLAGELSAQEYLEDKEVEFPLFARHQLELLRKMHRKGKAILQVEPYLERLIKIHQSLAAGMPRAQVEGQPELKEVYAAESRASRALLTFYTLAHTAPFPRVVAAVREFAQADAARFRLRDRLRAEALVPLADQYPRLYVEAGYIHLHLIKALVRQSRGRVQVRPLFLLAAPSLKAIKRPRPLGPGDLLTLRYIFGVPTSPATANLLAARSLIHIKLLGKKELVPKNHPHPHLTDEIRAWRLTEPLSFEDCAKLYPQVRRLSPNEAVAMVEKYLKLGEQAGRRPDTPCS